MIRSIRLDGFAMLLLVGLGLYAGLGLHPPAGADPFTGRHPETPAAASQSERAHGPIALVGRTLLTFQRETNRMIAEQMREIRDGKPRPRC
jgi:hypothetical protein